MRAMSKLKSAGLKTVYRYLDWNPEKNIPKILAWLERYDDEDGVQNQLRGIRTGLSNPSGNWENLLKSVFADTDAGIRRALFNAIVVNGSMRGNPLQRKLKEKHNCNIPWAILVDPTSACNLHCKGCWAAEYGNKLNLEFEELDDIVRQGKELGTYFYLFTGGEPLMRKKDLLKLCKKHPDAAFAAFTNATLIDEAFADEILEVKNFVPIISVEGFEQDTDFRRGKGTFAKVERAMHILRQKKVLFGASCCYTRENAQRIGSEAYFDRLIAWGVKFAWFFTYMPIGNDAVPELMATPVQREYMYRQVRRFRNEKPLFTLDFWNDGEYVGGCIAGGRSYLHINANGDVEPCAFIHYSDSNIREKTLLEALKSPLFMEYRKNQPFNENHLRPCPVLDNPARLAQIIEKTGAQSTDYQSPESAADFCAKCEKCARGWAPIAEKLWAEKHPEQKEHGRQNA